MAWDKTPSTHLDSWSEDGTDITVPLATFPELTAAEADATSGDLRKIAFALAEQFYQIYNGLATADRPGKMRIYRSSTTDESTGVVTRQYTLQFDCDIGSIDVADES